MMCLTWALTSSLVPSGPAYPIDPSYDASENGNVFIHTHINITS